MGAVVMEPGVREAGGLDAADVEGVGGGGVNAGRAGCVPLSKSVTAAQAAERGHTGCTTVSSGGSSPPARRRAFL